MIYIDDTDPEGTVEPSFPPRNVQIKRGTKAEELYELISEIGRGKFGTVYKCREKTTGLKLAAKFVPIPKREDRRNVEREVEIMNSLQHHLIIQLYAAYEYQKMMCVVLELVEGGELFDRVIDDDFILTERVCTVFVRQVCEAMQFIHRNNILHLDLKPENILCLTKEGNRIKIIDFGLARKYDPEKKLQVLFGTPEFVAPEVVNFDCISYGTDMWSVGVICYVLLSGLSPFMGETDLETMANVTIAKYDFDDEAFNNVAPEALDFITKLLVKDINERMSATECLEHKWLERRPRPPPIPPKPSNIPPPKYAEKIIPPSPTPPTSSAASPLPAERCNEENTVEKELDTTKDNLKTFIERWEEHPNSPYVFDTEANLIAPLIDAGKKGTSTGSSRGYSPSPCASITSVSDELFSPKESSPVKLFNDDIINSNKNLIQNNTNDNSQTKTKHNEQFIKDDKDQQNDISTSRNFRDYLQSFNRRNSDTNYIIDKRPTGERINLADEIRKLSDHLLMLAEINTKLERENQETIIEEESTSNSKQIEKEQHLEELEQQHQKLEKQQNKENDNNTNNNNDKNDKNDNNNNNSSDVSINNKNLHQDNKIEENNNVKAQRTNSNDNNVTNNKIPDKLKKTTKENDNLENTVALEMNSDSVINQEKEIFLKDDNKIRWEGDTKQKMNSSLSAHLQALEETPIIRQSTITGINKIEKQQTNTKSMKREKNLKNSSATKTSTCEITEESQSLQYSDLNGMRGYSVISFDTSSKIINDSNNIDNNNNNNCNNRNNRNNSISDLSFTNFGNASGVPWPITNRRIKFKINQMSRDVPVGSPDKHQSFNLEETASTTKDCLLHLLEKYTMTRNRTANSSGRHQSISIDWNMAENLEYRSMSSINAFFQRHSTNGNHINKVRAQLEAKSKN